MSSRGARRVWVSVAVAATIATVAACHDRSAPARERVLARIPAEALTVIAGDGAALGSSSARAVIDVLRPRWPARLGCAIDAMLMAEHVAIGVTARGTVIVIETAATVTCPALGKLDDRLWVATLGDATVAVGASVLDDARRARVRPYLLTAPIAVALELPSGSVIATARPDPLEAWLSFDTSPALVALAEERVKSYVAALGRQATTAPFAQRITVEREGSQVVARLRGVVDGELAAAVRSVVAEVGAPPSSDHAGASCPPLLAPVLGCAGPPSSGPTFEVSAIGAAISPILEAPLAPVVINARVYGLRIGAAVPPLGIAAGDVIIGAGGVPVTGRVQLSEILRRAAGRTSIVIERAQVTTTLSLVEP